MPNFMVVGQLKPLLR